MIDHTVNRPVSLENAREAKGILGRDGTVRRYAQGIGIGREEGQYCVRVNLEQPLPDSDYARLPKQVVTSHGDVVRVVYRLTGTIRAAAYA